MGPTISPRASRTLNPKQNRNTHASRQRRVEFLEVLLLVTPVTLIVTVPLSIAGWGVRESALVLAFSYAGLPESDGLVISVPLGATMLAIGLTTR